MKLSPNHEEVEVARFKISRVIDRTVADHHLSYEQLLRILSGEFGKWAKYLDRDEAEQQDEQAASTVRPAGDSSGEEVG